MSLNVGDRVRININFAKDFEFHDMCLNESYQEKLDRIYPNNPGIVEHMLAYNNKIFTVVELCYNNRVLLNEQGDDGKFQGWTWDERWLEMVSSDE